MTVRQPVQTDIVHSRPIDQTIESLFATMTDQNVVVASSLIDDEYPLWPGEFARVKNAIPSRRREYAAGRTAARHCLEQLGLQPNSILSGPRGIPIWPGSLVGSITHDGEWALAVAVNQTVIQGIGVDIVDLGRPTNTLPEYLIASKDDLHCLAQWSVSQSNAMPDFLLLAFSLKESVIKALSRYLDTYINLTDIQFTLFSNKLLARYSHSTPCVTVNAAFIGRYLITVAVIERAHQ